MTWVYDFAEGSKDQKDLLGGKGANIVFDDADLEVKKAGLAPVATIPAFTW